MVRAFSDFETNLTSVERVKEYCDLSHDVFYIFLNNSQFSQWSY
jgi:hypothetical protein